jgi:hypothetical protein
MRWNNKNQRFMPKQITNSLEIIGGRTKMSEYKEVRTTQKEPGYELRVITYKVTQFVWLAIILLETLIALRIGLKLLGANPANLFAAVLYGLTNIFLFPFTGLTNNPTYGNMVLEITSFFGMIIYALVGWIIDRLIYLVFYWPRSSIVRRQTVVSEHAQTSRPAEVTQTITTDRTSRSG